MSNIIVYRDNEANAVIIAGSSIGMKFNNEMHAVGNGDGTLRLKNLPKEENGVDFDECSNIAYARFVDGASNPIGVNELNTVNNLNAIFQVTGTGGSELPVITSSLAVPMTQGDSLNYTLEGDFGANAVWDFTNVFGVTTKIGNIFKLEGGSGLGLGAFNVPVDYINGNGKDSKTIVITVSSPPYNNTKSVKFNNNDYCEAIATTSHPMYRASNGTGASDAWSFEFYLKPGTHTGGAKQTLVMFGENSNNGARVHLHYKGNDKKLTLRYGTDANHLELVTPNNSLIIGTYIHGLVTYTGNPTDNLNYGEFKIILNDVVQTTTNSHSGNGYAGEMFADLCMLGKNGSKNDYLKDNCLLDEVSFFNTEESSNSTVIYNGGVPHDLVLLASPPINYIRMGDNDTFPTLQDTIGSLDYTMTNMSSGDIVNDVP